MKDTPMRWNRSWRTKCGMNVGHSILLYVAITAVIFIALDGLIESNHFSILKQNLSTENDDLYQAPGSAKKTSLETHYAMIPINHYNLTSGTFLNRYWINDKFYRLGGPVFVYDTGEGDASESVERMLERPSSFMGQLLEEFHGLGILWEHRYYGESQPFPDIDTLSSDDYEFLTLNQSLADLPFFAANFSLDTYPGADLRPSSTPWIMVGCSYSGTRAAFSRAKYPETFFAAFAESTVVQLEVEVDGYGTELHRSLVDHGHANCSRDLHSLLEYVDNQLDHAESSASIKQQYLGVGAASISNTDFVSAILSLFMYFKGWGIQDGRPSIVALCEHLEDVPAINASTPAAAPADFHDPRSVSDRLASWPDFLTHVNKLYDTSCNLTSAENLNNCTLSDKTIYSSRHENSWLWQQCTELGLFVAQESSTTSLTSKHLSIDHRIAKCRDTFGMDSPTLLSDITRRVELTNQQFGGNNMRPSNVFWTTGQYDTYRACSPLSRTEVENDAAPVVLSQQVSTCNVSTGHDSLFGLLLPEKGHCEIIARNSTEAMHSRRMFADALHEWLRCF